MPLFCLLKLLSYPNLFQRGGSDGERDYKGARGNFEGVMEVLDLFVAVVTWIHISVKTH